ncbi:MAG: ABC transporter permease [Sphingobacteriaceae bacterium]
MLKNYLNIALRSLWKNKFYTLLNISGLTVGLATGIMLLLWVENEKSYDRFHQDHEQIYRLSSQFKSNDEVLTWTGVPGPLAVFAKSIPGIQAVVRTQNDFAQVLTNNDRTKIIDGNNLVHVDNDFFTMFDFKLLQGQRSALFPNSHSAVLTKSTAEKLYGKGDAIGKVIQYGKHNFTVTGILEDFPKNSSLQYDAIFPMSDYAEQFTKNGGNGDWKTIDEDMGNYGFTTFVKLLPNADPVKTGALFSSAYKQARNGESDTQFALQSLESIHLVNADGNDASKRMVQVFMLIVILLLVIASINYVNLSTARSLVRAKEVSVRKIIGAEKWQLFLQFTIETTLVFFFATVLAAVLIFLTMPLYNNISGQKLSLDPLNFAIWKVVAFAIAGTWLTSSIYPALLLASFKPIQALQGKFVSGMGASALRKGLVVFQFAISVILLVGTIVMSRQMDYIRNKDLGYDKSYVFSVPLTDDVVDHLDAIKSELKSNPNIVSVGISNAYNMSSFGNATGDIEWVGKSPKSNFMIKQMVAQKDFISTMKIQLLEGEDFSGTPADSNYFILNETAVKQMGLKKPYVGQQITFHNKKGVIRGVTKDFNFESLKEKVAPILLFNWWSGNILFVRTNGKNTQQALAAVEMQYKKYGGDSPFSYNFVDKQFESQYETDQRAGTLFRLFSGIAIFISCLGLFGLATYTAQVKFKEIGIRKVLGASVSGIVRLISNDFLKLVVIAIIIATPVAWWAMHTWLQGFAYRVDIGWWMFAIAGILALLIALVTVSFQAVKAALMNPVKSLRSE